MRVAVAYDHRGRKGVESVKTTIEQQGHECIDLGPKEETVVDCPDFAYIAGMMVKQKEADTAILLCTTGVGMSMSANKIEGVRAARCCDEFDARAARLQFDANVLCLSGELLDENELRRIVDTWLSSDFEGQKRSNRLIRKIRAIEQGQDPQQVTDTSS
jgi:ribose 5-phosphate isomerase B